MKTKNNAPWVVGILLLLVVCAAVREFKAARESRSRLALLSRQSANALVEAKKLRALIATMDRDKNGLTQAAAAKGPEKSSPEPVEMIRKRMRILRSWISLKYGAFYRKAGLSHEQIAQFEDLMANHYMRSQDIVATAHAENLAMSDPAIQQLGKEEYAQFRQEETALLGDQVIQELRQSERLAPVSELTDGVAGNAYLTDTLSAQQADQLTQILANNSLSYQKGKIASPTDLDFPAVIAQAQTVLSSSQLEALQNLHDANLALAKLNTLLPGPSQASPPPPQAPAPR